MVLFLLIVIMILCYNGIKRENKYKKDKEKYEFMLYNYTKLYKKCELQEKMIDNLKEQIESFKEKKGVACFRDIKIYTGDEDE